MASPAHVTPCKEAQLPPPPDSDLFSEHLAAVTRPVDAVERALLAWLLALLHRLDADLVVGQDIAAFDLGVLLHRIDAN